MSRKNGSVAWNFRNPCRRKGLVKPLSVIKNSFGSRTAAASHEGHNGSGRSRNDAVICNWKGLVSDACIAEELQRLKLFKSYIFEAAIFHCLSVLISLKWFLKGIYFAGKKERRRLFWRKAIQVDCVNS